MEQADFIIQPRWTVPVVPRGAVLENHALVVRAGRIVALLPRTEVEARFEVDAWIEKPDHVLIPGLINAHTHAAMTLFRGLADDMPLQQWLEEHIWPAEMHWVGGDFVRDGTDLAMLEMLSGGITCFSDMYFYPDTVAQAAIDRGMRAVVGMIVIEAPTPWAKDAKEYLAKGLAVHDQFLGSELVTTAFAPHAPYSVSDATLSQISVLANELDTVVHMHVHETVAEVQGTQDETGHRPLARLDQLGLLNPLLSAVHMTQLSDDEIKLAADRGINVVHCPESNLKLASGFCPVEKLLRAGVNVALGTDGASSNNDLDMFAEMRTAALLGKGVAGDAAAVSATDALAMATINGAIAMGLGEQTGSLEPGKWADLVCVDLSAPATQPVHHPISQLVYAAGRDNVSDVWVAGNAIMRDGRLTADDTDELLARTRAWQTRIAEKSTQA